MRACTLAGVQAGFHVIGDAAVDQVILAVETVAAELGVPPCAPAGTGSSTRDDRRPDIERMRDLGMVASVQPAFDAAWGGDAGMYAERLGVERALATNPFADLADAGVALALGSDAPVTPLDPWGGVHAAVDHRTPGSGLRPFDAFDAATHGGWYAARAEHPAGPLAVGAPATSPSGPPTETLSAVLTDAGARPPAACCSSTAPRSETPHEQAVTSTPPLVARARELAALAAQPVIDLAHRHTTVSVERAVLRLAGLTGTDPVTGEGRTEDRVPWVNRVVDAVRDQVGLEHGVALPVWHALASGDGADLQRAGRAGRRRARPASSCPTGADADRARAAARRAAAAGIARIDANRRRREELVATHGDPPRRPGST